MIKIKFTYKIIIMFLAISFFPVSGIYAGSGCNTLMSVGSSQKRMDKALNQETRTYEKIKAAVEEGEIETGQSQKEILKRYGEPVIILTEDNKEKWVYKPGNASFFDRVKIYLIFDEDKILECVENVDKQDKEQEK